MTQRAAFRDSGFFVLRTPLLPFAALVDWTSGLELTDALRQTDPDAALAANVAMLRHRLAQAWSSPELQEALFIASPSLAASYSYWLTNPFDERGRRIERGLVRYYTRLITRSTPFGLCAGISVGTTGDRTVLDIDGRGTYRRHTRLDVGHVAAIAARMENDDDVRRRLTYRPNSTLYQISGHFRYAERSPGGLAGVHTIVALAASDYLEAVLERAANGSTLEELVQVLLRDDPSLDHEEAEDYIDELATSHILVSSLEPAVTGDEPFARLVQELTTAGAAEEHLTALHDLAAALDRINRAPLGMPVARYADVTDGLRALNVETDPSRLFHVDLIKPAPSARLDHRIISELQDAVHLLRRLHVEDPARAAIARFTEAFARRYEMREVPLVEALDEDFGIGFGEATTEPSSLLEGVVPGNTRSDRAAAWTMRERFLLGKLQTLEPGEELRVTASDFVDADGDAVDHLPALPAAAQLSFRLQAPPQATTMERQYRLFLETVGGPSGVNVLGRFCHADALLTSWVKAHVRQEEERDADAIFAEVAHLAAGSAGNTVLRPALREYEIAYLGRSGVPLAKQIPLTDLMVSLQHGRLVLRSARLARTVHPRLTTAHNYLHHGPSIYRFLCTLHHQDSANFAFTWGRLGSLKSLPRVISGRCVLALAQWMVDRTDIDSLDAGSPVSSLKAFHALCQRLRLPRYFCLVDDQGEFVVDTQNALLVQAFMQMIAGRAFAKLTEVFPAPDGLIVRGPEGRFLHEIILPVVDAEQPESQPQRAPMAIPTRERQYVPGSEWLFVKLYCGNANADLILAGIVAPLVSEAIERVLVDRWFFVRYADPDWHIRLRLHGQPASLWQEVLPLLYQSLRPVLDTAAVWRVQVDSYVRELERYGGLDGTIVSEELFFADSVAALSIVSNTVSAAGLDERWRLTLLGMDRLLNDLGLTLEAKAALLAELRTAGRREHRLTARSVRALGAKHRAERTRLDAMLDGLPLEDEQLGAGVAAFEQRSARIRALGIQLRQLANSEKLSVTIPDLCKSYLHMHANRMFRRDARLQEFVLYDLLGRLYESQLARLSSRTP